MNNRRRRKRGLILPDAACSLIIALLLAVPACLFVSSCGRQGDSETSEFESSSPPAANHSDDAPSQSGETAPPPPADAGAREAFMAGQRLLNEKRPRIEEAEEKFTLAIEHDGDYGPAYFQRGMCRRLGGRHEEALNDFLRAAELMPGEPNPMFHAAWTLLDTGRLDEARGKFEVLAERFPDNRKSHYFLGVIAERQRDLPRALECFNAALEKDPDHAESLIERACLYAIFSEFDESLADIDRLRKKAADDPKYGYLEGNIYLMRGRWRMDRALRAGVKDDERERLAGSATEDFGRAVAILAELLRGGDVPVFWGIAHAEAVASRSSEREQFYAAAAEQFEMLLKEVRAGITETKADALWIFVPRLQRDMAVVKMATGGEEARDDVVKHLKKAIFYADELPGLWKCDGISLIDKWFAYRAICDAMHGLVKIKVGSRNDYEGARKYLEKLSAFQSTIKADYGKAALERKREMENIQEAVYECEFQEAMPAESAEYTYEECVGLLAHPYYKFRAAGLICLSKEDDPKCRAHIVEALNDPDDTVVMLAVKLIEEKEIRAAAPKLAALIGSDMGDVTLPAITCLGTLLKRCTTAEGDLVLSDETRAGVPALIKAMESEASFVREAAIDALSDVTGRTLMYHYDDQPGKRAAAVERWKEWWREISRGG